MAKRKYIQANKEWLEAKAKEEYVKALPKGIYYKVLSEGDKDGLKPTVRSIITAHYTGWTIDGKQFDSSHGGVPLACRLCDLIEGWIIAIQQMHIGDKWEIYIPAEMGYGTSAGNIEGSLQAKRPRSSAFCLSWHANRLFV